MSREYIVSKNDKILGLTKPLAPGGLHVNNHYQSVNLLTAGMNVSFLIDSGGSYFILLS